MAVAVHPDDETLGCGGTLLRHAQSGACLHWLLVTAAQTDNCPQESVEVQQAQVDAVRNAYPFAAMDWLRMPTTRLESVGLRDIIRAVEEVIERVRPDVVYIPHWADSHSDHRIVSDAVLAVLKSFYMLKRGVRRVLACEVISETDAAPAHLRPAFVPNVFVDISETLERKLEIFSLYRTEVHPEPLPRSASALRAQARTRGATIGVPYAECFSMVREIS